ncbi:MAG: flippase [Caldilineae bacterium]|nr:MAG: flippase [Caldilineae bacterium]
MVTGGPKPRGGPSLTDIEQEIGEIARGAGVGLGGNIVFYGISYLFGILVARQVGAEQYGLYTLGVTAVSLFSRVTIVGLDRGLMRFASISRGEQRGSALRHVAVLALVVGALTGTLGALILWLAPDWVLRTLRWQEQSGLRPLLPLLAVTVPAMTLTGIAIAGTQAFRTMRYRALVTNVFQPLLKLLAALLLIPLLGPQALAPVLAFILSQVLGTLLALYFLARLARSIPPLGDPEQALGSKLARFSAPLFLSNVIEYLNGRTELIVLGMFLTADFSGIYNASIRLAGLGLIVLTAFNAIFSPMISDLHHRHKTGNLATLFKLVSRWIVAVAMPIFLAQMLFAPRLMSLFGPEFVGGASALRLLSLGQMVNLATGSVGIMLIMSGRTDVTFLNSLLTLVLALILDFLLVPRLGLTGAATAGALVLAVVNLVRLAEVWALLRIHPFSLPYLKPFAAALPAALAGLAWNRWLPLQSLLYLAAACIAVGLVYLLALLALRLDEGDMAILKALRARLIDQPLRKSNL